MITPQEPLTEKHLSKFTDRSSSSIPPVVVSQKDIEKQTINTSIDLLRKYWIYKNEKYLPDFEKGMLIGTFGTNQSTLDDYFDKLFDCIKQSVLNEYQKKERTTEELKEIFNLLKTTLKILVDKLKEVDKSTGPYKFDVYSLNAFLEGFVVSYIKNILDK